MGSIFKVYKGFKKMKTYKDYLKFWQPVLKKQLEIANLNDNFDFDRDDWFLDVTVTQEQQDEFEKWFLNYIIDNWKEFRKQGLVYGYYKSKKQAQKIVNEWLLFYFWKVKN